MATSIHPTSIVDPKAEIGVDVVIAPYVVIDAGVELGDRCVIGPFSYLRGPSRIGPDNRFESHVCIGSPPQISGWSEAPTRLEIGARNVFQAFVSLHRGTVDGGGLTRIGDDGLYMVDVVVAHDCDIGSRVVLGKSAAVAGHCIIGDCARLSGMAKVQQFCRVGTEAFVGADSLVTKDCLPFMRTIGQRPARCYGVNEVGLERRGYAASRLGALRTAWRYIHSPKLSNASALERIELELGEQPDIRLLLDFIASSSRGVTFARG